MKSARNIAVLTDSYKLSHYNQYPPGTTGIFSYFESRGFDEHLFPSGFNEICSAGLQYFLQEYLAHPITKADIDFAEEFCNSHMGAGLFNRSGWDHILDKHGGNLPVSIKAVPEGTIVPLRNVLMTVENTDPACYWLTNYLETLLVQAWYPTTVATLSREMKKIILQSLRETGDPNLIALKLHDFGFRGVSSVESAGLGGFAHLINFMGTDTMPALLVAREIYGEPMAGFSIPAAEHSTITSWGRTREREAYDNMLTQYPKGLVAVVSDSYDIERACKEIWGQQLKRKVMDRDGTLVIRPDSGVPHEMVVKVLNILGEYFDPTINLKGYRVLPRQVRVIQGDGIDLEETRKIAAAIKEAGWSMDNLAFGMGGALLQKLNRDTLKFAFKCSSAVINGEAVDVYKRPASAPWKASKKGRLKLVENPDCGFVTLNESQPGENKLVEVFRNGEIKVKYSLSDIRKRASL